jgi:uncharacterized membrane protein
LVSAVLLAPSGILSHAQASVSEANASYFTIQIPGALGTFPTSLNRSMAVTGYYMVSPTQGRGFLQSPGGAITTFAVPGSLLTEPESINDPGDITGFYVTQPGFQHGFVRYANGRIYTFDGPCATGGSTCGAVPVSINNFKEIAGSYPSPLQDRNNFLGGLSRSAQGVLSSYVLTQGGSYSTIATAVNASGSVIGYFTGGGGNGDTTSFELHPDGYWFEFRLPPEQAGGLAGSLGATLAESSNASGVIAGWYRVCSSSPCGPGITGGFLRSTQGAFTLFNPPGLIVTSPAPETFLAINDDGVVTGSYTDAGLAQHGFVLDVDGVITSFDPPQGMQTTATSINDSGVIAGSFYAAGNPQTSIGFLRIPTP